MSDRYLSCQETRGSLVRLGLVLILLSVFVAFPSAARADIRHIGVGDAIFIYEQNLDITGLRTGANPVTALRKYQDDNPTLALLREIPVQDDTNFNPIPESFGGVYGVYYAYNPTDGAMNSVLISVPSLSIDAVLASPNHSDSIQGLTLHDTNTPVAFKITSVDVGTYYHAGALYPATVDLVLTTPGGGQLTTIQGKDFSRMTVNAQQFYTDDAGRPGAITFANLGGAGTYTVQAKWHDPSSFDMQAPDSGIISFSIGATTVSTGTTTPPPPTPVVTTLPPATPIPVTTPLTPVTTSPPPVTPSTPPATPPATTTVAATTPQPSPTPMPIGTWLPVLSIAFVMIPLVRRRTGR